jgi:hypothetical protein
VYLVALKLLVCSREQVCITQMYEYIKKRGNSLHMFGLALFVSMLIRDILYAFLKYGRDAETTQMRVNKCLCKYLLAHLRNSALTIRLRIRNMYVGPQCITG